MRPPLPQGPYLVAGLGRAGRAAVGALRGVAGPDAVLAWDSATTRRALRARRELEAAGVRTLLGESDGQVLAWAAEANTLVKSPGIPWEAPVVRDALESGLEVLDELELGWRLARAPVLAVTGTNGKSTTAGLAAAVLAAGGRAVELAGNTHVGRPLSAAAWEPLDWIVCEVSSFQLEGSPHFLPDVAVFTNLTPEHLGRHRTLERYGDVKRRLFLRGGTAAASSVIDVQDPFGSRLAGYVEAAGGAVARVGFGPDADYRVLSARWDLRGARLCVATPSGEVRLETRLPGRYNARNVAAALAIGDTLGVERADAAAAIESYAGAPARFEHVDEGQGYDVIVDYAHTPDGLEQFLTAVRAGMSPAGRLRTVFGIGGVAGSGLRGMGAVARTLSDELILTISGFRGQPPVLALRSVLGGARAAKGCPFELDLDRRRAMRTAFERSSAGDVVVIPGRGSEAYMNADPRGLPQPFDDREVARELLRSLG